MRQKRSHRIDIRLTLAEYEKAQLMADENNLTMSELFRAKTLKNRLPRRVTKV
ncbi:MAG: plasmid mobilization protein, partial [Nostoc sp.]